MSITVVTPIYNQWHYLERCIRSVEPELQPGDEHIVVDDGSAGAVPHIRCQSSLRLIRVPERCGVSAARNIAIREAKGEWIKFLDADDMLVSGALNAFRSLIKSGPPKIVVVGSQLRIQDGDSVGEIQPSLWIKFGNPFCPSMAFVRIDALREVGMFDERIEFEEDYDLWLRIWKHFGDTAFLVLGEPVCHYCIHTQEKKYKPRHTIAGTDMDVRDYFKKQYGIGG